MSTPKKIAINAAVFSIVSNALLAIIKGLAGFFGNSYALIADAIESFNDVLSSALVLFGLSYANRPADRNHPYGHGRIEPLITFIVVGFLLFSAGVIAYESIQHLYTPHKTPKTYTLYILAAIVIFKEIMYRIILRKSKITKSTSLKADAWHHRSDAITSLLAFTGISIAIFMGPGYENADDWAALIASGIIIFNAFLIFRPALAEIMDEHIHDETIETIKTIADDVEGVLYAEKCHIRKTGMHYYVDLHLTVNGNITVKEGHDISHKAKNEIIRQMPEIADVLVHIEPDDLQNN